jgi:YHS domain-containing protein
MRIARLSRLTLAVAAVLVLAAGLAQAGDAASTPLKKVEAKKVCMVNDALFEKDQIPVAYEGRTYYGCCEMCKERLAKDAKARTGVDPVSGKPVDKATAVIAAKPDGSVLYFENDANLKTYTEQQAKQDKQ